LLYSNNKTLSPLKSSTELVVHGFSTVYAVIACSSVSPSQIGVVSKRLKYTRKQYRIISSDSVYDAKDLYEIPVVSPQQALQGAPNVGGMNKNCVFRPVEKSTSETPAHTLYRRKFGPSATVAAHDLDGALAEKYSMSSTTFVKVC